MKKDYTLPTYQKYPIAFPDDPQMQADYEHTRDLGATHQEAKEATLINFGIPIITPTPKWAAELIEASQTSTWVYYNARS